MSSKLTRLKSLGMTSKEVSHVFLLRAWKIVWKGLLWGNAVGLGLCLIQKYTGIIRLDPASYFVNCVPIALSPLKIIILNVAAAGLIMAIVSISSRFISKVSPDRTMRVE